jgi:hypothetical protein
LIAPEKHSSEIPQKRKSLEEMVSRLMANDGFSANGIACSSTLTELFAAYGYAKPTSASTIMNLMEKFYHEKKNDVILDLKGRLENGERFSTTKDEWSNVTGKRYLNVNLHNKSTINLGLVRIRGSFSAEKMEEAVRNHLSVFRLDMTLHIVRSTTDGCAMMIKFGRLIEIEHAVCQNHTNHLAVCDVVHKGEEVPKKGRGKGKKEKGSNEKLSPEDDLQEDEEMEEDPNDEDARLEIVEELSDVSDDLFYAFFNDKIKPSLDKTRKIVKFLSGSDIRNNILQSYVKKEYGKELKLILDFKTRWHTIHKMIERFLNLKSAVKSALQELGRLDLFTSVNIKALEELLQVLEPTVEASRAMERSNVSLIESDITMELLCKNLSGLKSDLAKQMLTAVDNRYNQRKNKTLITLARFLHNRHFFKKEHYFPYSSKEEVLQLAKTLKSRLYLEVLLSHEEINDEIPPKRIKLSIQEQLESALHNETFDGDTMSEEQSLSVYLMQSKAYKPHPVKAREFSPYQTNFVLKLDRDCLISICICLYS